MKKIITALAFTLIGLTPTYADVYVKVDANGVAIDGAIVCDAGTCGDPNSLYSKLTLKEGERYVLQGNGTVGIGGNNPGTTVQVKEEAKQNVWTVTSPTAVQTITVSTDPVAPAQTTVVQPTQPTPTKQETTTVTTETTTVTTADTATALITETPIATIQETATTTTTYDFSAFDWNAFWNWFVIWYEQIYGVKP